MVEAVALLRPTARPVAWVKLSPVPWAELSPLHPLLLLGEFHLHVSESRPCETQQAAIVASRGCPR